MCWQGGPASSPPARGTQRCVLGLFASHRFIPARAGNTSARRRRRFSRTLHPRPRGEHGPLAGIRRIVGASSPPARGTRVLAQQQPPRCRFIPARAGNTPGQIATKRRRSLHPRPRGEHGEAPIKYPLDHASSPPARGTRARRVPRLGQGRFIPARAGNTSGGSRHHRPRSLHPRPRGEHNRRMTTASGLNASSPPARGTRPPAPHG